MKIKWQRINKVIVLLTISDVFTWGIYSVLSVITGLYLSIKLHTNTVQIIGTGVFIYFLARALVPIPAGYIIDKLKGKADEAWMLLLGSVLMGCPYLIYPLITSPLIYYLLQFVFGIGTALNLVSWRKIFATNLNKNRAGTEYAFYDTVMSLFSALTGLSAGYIANINLVLFEYVIVGLGMLMVSSGIWAVLYLKTIQTD